MDPYSRRTFLRSAGVAATVATTGAVALAPDAAARAPAHGRTH
ncbi:MAG: hypothetical protein JWQ03_2665, partial [Variovorax sp.]|nr:hypothetical protein [Variovorax sp.]